MVKKHIISINAPKSWPVERKAEKFLLRPMPGRKFETAMPLGIILKNILKVATTTKEAKSLLREGKILVNKKKVTEVKFPAGLMDVIELPELSSAYRILLNSRGKLVFKKIDEKEASLKPCKIINKKSLKGGKTQFNLDDGTNLLSENKTYKVGDTLVLEFPEMKVKEHLKMEKGALVYITAGTKVSKKGNFESFRSFKGSQPDNIVVKTNEGMIETKKGYALAIGSGNKSAINVE